MTKNNCVNKEKVLKELKAILIYPESDIKNYLQGFIIAINEERFDIENISVVVVKKAIAKWEGHFSVVNFFDLKTVEYKQGYIQALNDIKKELDLNKSDDDSKESSVRKNSVVVSNDRK